MEEKELTELTTTLPAQIVLFMLFSFFLFLCCFFSLPIAHIGAFLGESLSLSAASLNQKNSYTILQKAPLFFPSAVSRFSTR